MNASKTHYRVAAVQAAPEFLDLDKGVDKAIRLIKEAADNGASLGGLKEQVQQSVNFSEHANHETGQSRLRNIVTTWRLNEPSLPD